MSAKPDWRRLTPSIEERRRNRKAFWWSETINLDCFEKSLTGKISTQTNFCETCVKGQRADESANVEALWTLKQSMFSDAIVKHRHQRKISETQIVKMSVEAKLNWSIYCNRSKSFMRYHGRVPIFNCLQPIYGVIYPRHLSALMSSLPQLRIKKYEDRKLIGEAHEIRGSEVNQIFMRTVAKRPLLFHH